MSKHALLMSYSYKHTFHIEIFSIIYSNVYAKNENKKNPFDLSIKGTLNKNLAVTYSHMGRPHTTIGAGRLHFRVRNGIGWFPSAMAARQTE